MKKLDEIINTNNENVLLSPSSYYLKFQNLTLEEKKYIESQDKRLLAKLNETKKLAEKNKSKIPNKFQINLEDFKKNQNSIKESLEVYNNNSNKKKQPELSESLWL